jgi:prepilin-type N-terminal cleavage/methylation domain-containing protein
MRRKQIGFTLVELLVVMAIISILAAMLMPALARARAQARAAACRSNMKQIGYSYGMYMGDYDEFFPTSNNVPFPMSPDGWGIFWQAGHSTAPAGVDCYMCPLHILAHHGYLNEGWEDNRDRITDSVCRCPGDRAATKHIPDMQDNNDCKLAHCAYGLTMSYSHLHQMHLNYYFRYRDFTKIMDRPGATCCTGEYDWWNGRMWAGVMGIRSGGHPAYFADDNQHCPLERHGGDSINILYCDMHVANTYAFKWSDTQAFARDYDTRGESEYFYWPLGYGL